MATETHIRLRGITKRFPGILALDRIDLDIPRGEVMALVGENGAGKSTLGRVIAGIHRPDGGTMELRGEPVRIETPVDAMRYGIGMVHQELAFCPELTIAQNLCLGDTPRTGPLVNRREMAAKARRLLDAIQAGRLDVERPMKELSTAQEQLVQIAAAVGRGADVVIFDEPTSSLSAVEAEHLFALIKQLRARGVTILYVSHRMEEIFRLTDSVAVLRDGRLVAVKRTDQVTRDDVVHLMIGREVEEYFPEHGRRPRGRELLRVEGLRSPGSFQGIDFSLHEGEILGLGGLVGAGRSELARAIFGLDPGVVGTVYVRGEAVRIRSVRQAMKLGIGLVPEDRKREGLVLGMNIGENTVLPTLRRVGRGPLRDRRAERAVANEYFQKLRVRANGLTDIVAGLSGGNQQKVALAKWLAAECPILIVDEPTRGIDLGAKAEIHKLLGALVAQGRGILLISSEMPELLNLSDRILVLREGAIAGELSREEASEEALLRLMTGVGREHATGAVGAGDETPRP